MDADRTADVVPVLQMRFPGPLVVVIAALSSQLLAVGGCKEKKERRRVEPATETVPAETIAATQPPKGPSGTITGVIRFTGTAPEMPFINNGTDPVCAAKKLRAETILVNANGTLRNAIARVKPGTVPGWIPTEPVLVKQLDCMYRPRVQGAVAGQKLIVENNDETSHNVHVRAAKVGDRQGAQALWNRQQPKKSMGLEPIRTVVEDHPVMRLKCDMHGWMSGYLLVSDNPYSAVTGEDGAFSMQVPVGERVIEAWHEFYGLKQATVTVTEGQTTTVEFTFDATADNPTASKQPAKGT